MSQDYTEWRNQVDLALQGLNKFVGELQSDVSLLKTVIDGFKLSQEAIAGAQENILNELSDMREKTTTSVGLDAVIAQLSSIENAIRSGGTRTPAPVEAPPARPPVPRQPTPPTLTPPPRTPTTEGGPMPVDEDTADVDWRIKGNVEARDTDPFAYAFVYTNREQTTMRDSVRNLVALCEQHGTVLTTDKFLVKLGGTNNSLLNRNIPK